MESEILVAWGSGMLDPSPFVRHFVVEGMYTLFSAVHQRFLMFGYVSEPSSENSVFITVVI